MGFGKFVHHIGTVLLFIATILLIVATISAPVVDSLGMMKVHVGRNNRGINEVVFGSFGYCTKGSDDYCSKKHIGYDPAYIINGIDGSEFSSAAHSTSKGLTKVMILHPVAVVLCFIAFVLCAITGMVGAVVAGFMALLAFIVTLVAMICDFVTFAIIKHDINSHGISTAKWGSGIWMLLVSAILTLIASLLVFVTCCAARKSKSRHQERHKESWNEQPVTGGRKRFWQRR